MKKLILGLAASALFSCSAKEENANILENLSYTVDTVMVDAGEEIINLKFGLVASSFSTDFQTLFIFDEANYSIQQIDLNLLKLTHSYPFEKEGPNGLEPFRSFAFQSLSNDSILFVGGRKLGIFSKTGVLSFGFNYSFEQLISQQRAKFSTRLGFIYDESTQKGFWLEGNSHEADYSLIVIDFKDRTSTFIDLPEMDRTYDFRVSFDYVGYRVSLLEDVQIQKFHSDYFISTSVNSGLYWYNPELDSLVYVTFPHKLTPTEKTIPIKNEVGSKKEKDEQIALIKSQIKFHPFIWDDKSQRFFRFSSIAIPSSIPDSETKYEIYLYAYDEDLNLLGETRLEGLDQIPSNTFFKNGKLWSYANVDDELGFAVMELKF